MRITLGPKNLWQCSTQPPFTTQTREIEGRKASLPMEQVSQSGHLAQQMLDEHANLYGQVLSQCQYFLVSKSIYFPWQNAHTATKKPRPLPTCPEPRSQAAQGSLLTAAVLWSLEKVICWSEGSRRSERGGWRNVVHGEGKPECEYLKENMKSLDDNAVPSTGKIEKLSGFTLLKECNKCTWIPPFSS